MDWIHSVLDRICCDELRDEQSSSSWCDASADDHHVVSCGWWKTFSISSISKQIEAACIRCVRIARTENFQNPCVRVCYACVCANPEAIAFEFHSELIGVRLCTKISLHHPRFPHGFHETYEANWKLILYESDECLVYHIHNLQFNFLIQKYVLGTTRKSSNKCHTKVTAGNWVSNTEN